MNPETTFSSRALGFVSLPMQAGSTVCESVRYDEFVRRLFKVDTLNEMLHHAKGGVCEEAGELSDAIKRNLTYGIPLGKPIRKDTTQTVREAIIEELGDVRFYLQAVMNIYGISEQEVLQANGIKLSTRYKELTYSDSAAFSRSDKDQ